MSSKDPFWWDKPRILWSSQRITEIWPSKYQSFEERVNASSRFFLIAGALISFTKMNPLYFMIGLLLTIVLAFLTRFQNGRRQESRFPRHWFPEESKYLEDTCHEPTEDNPFQNTLSHHYDDAYNKQPACVSHENKEVIKDLYLKDVPVDFSDPYQRTNGFRQFYSMPSTTIPNDQSAFAEWLYGSIHSVKEKNAN